MMLRLQCRAALTNLLNTKMRSLLAILGILIGTASVVAMLTCAQLAEQKALAEFKLLGTNLMSVGFYSQQSTQASPSLDFALSMQQSTPEIETLSPYISLYNRIYNGNKILNGSTIGAQENLQNLLKIKLQQGRFIRDLDHYAYFCVIGHEIAEKLHRQGLTDLLGKQILLDKHYFTIIGIAAPWLENSFFNQNINRAVLIPLQTATLINKNAKIRNILLYLKDNVNIDAVETHIKQTIIHAKPHAHVYFHSAKQIISSMENQSRIYTILLGLIGSISLIVGGIGIMNIMLVSVTERRREIGICMAIGARRRDIRKMFLIEAVILSLFGGALGILFGVMTSATIAYFAGWQFVVFPTPIIVGFAVSASIGIFFGYYPAYQASKLNPIDALRSE